MLQGSVQASGQDRIWIPCKLFVCRDLVISLKGFDSPRGYFLFTIDYLAMHEGKADERFMRAAIDAAEIAEENGDVPIGAVIVYENRIIARAYNQR